MSELYITNGSGQRIKLDAIFSDEENAIFKIIAQKLEGENWETINQLNLPVTETGGDKADLIEGKLAEAQIMTEIYLGNGDGRRIKLTALFPESENAILRFQEQMLDGETWNTLGNVDINPNRQSIERVLLIDFNGNAIVSGEEGIITGSLKEFLDNNYAPL